MSTPTLPKSETNHEEPVNTPVELEISLTPFNDNPIQNATTVTLPVTDDVKEESKVVPPVKPQGEIPSSFVKLHHELEEHYVLPEYCVPVEYCIQQCSLEACKFKRDCLIMKSEAE